MHIKSIPFTFFIISLLIICACASAGSNSTADNNSYNISGGYYYTSGNDALPNPNYEETGWNNINFYDLPLWIQISFVSMGLLIVSVIFYIFPFFIGRLKNVLDHETRQTILKYIKDNPGCTIADISGTKDINRGTVKYHIFQLQLNGKIFTKRDGKFSRLFHKTTAIKDLESTITPHLRNETSCAILREILDRPGITNQELSSRFNLDKSTVSWYLQKFNSDGIVDFMQDGKFRKCFVNTEAKMVLLRYMPA